MRLHPILAMLGVTLLLVPAFAADVLVVDGTDPTAYQLPQDAVDAAQIGDVILVRPGVYTPPPSPIDQIRHPVVIDKGLTLIGEDGPAPSIGLVRIENLPAGEAVVLSHLLIEPLGTFPFDAQFDVGVNIVASQGVIHIEDCDITGADLFTFPGMRITDSSQVVISRSTAVGGVGSGDWSNSTPGGPGLELDNSEAAVLHSTITGGLGGSIFFHPPGTPDGSPGGPGVLATDSELRVLGSTLQAGPASSSCSGPCGAPGLVLEGPSVVRAVGSAWVADSGGPDLVNPDGFVFAYADTVPELSGPPTITPAGRGTLTMRGEPGDTIGIFFALSPGYAGLNGKKGVFGVGSPFAVPIVLGPLPGSGELSLPLGGIPLQGAVALTTTWQVYAASPTSSEFILSNPYELMMLGDGL